MAQTAQIPDCSDPERIDPQHICGTASTAR
jgi:hypothetical protein